MACSIARTVIDGSTYSFDKCYDYLIPDGVVCQPGCRVIVPFGRGNSQKQALVLEVLENSSLQTLKHMISVVDSTPVLTTEMLGLIKWLKEHTFCTYYDAVHAVLPSGLNIAVSVEYGAANVDVSALSGLKSRIYELLSSSNKTLTEDKIAKTLGIESIKPILESMADEGIIYRETHSLRKIGDASVKMAQLTDPEGETAVRLTPKQRRVVELLRDAGTVSVKEITYFTGIGQAVIKNLEKYGVIRLFDNEIYRRPHIDSTPKKVKEVILTQEQSRVYDTVCEKQRSGEFSTVLMHGVTGSGKTQVFLKLAEETVAAGRGVIVMVPEIALTPQMLDLFYSRFGNMVAVFHSALPLGQRLDEWKRVKKGKARIALGTRSAVFAPFDDIGLIVMDEEQEHTYKSEQSPRFHTRDVARFRCAYHKCVCLLSSATPSIESYSAAQSGKYTLCTMKNRYGNAVLPDVIPVDMRSEVARGNNGNLSMILADEIQNNLDNNRQSILLLNRRGHNTYVSCPACGYVATCKNCSISMTYHSASGRLMCHYCGYSEPYSTTCPSCSGNHLRYSGAGTQKLEDELSLLFPKARVLRLDADTTMARNAFSEKLSAFSKGEYDILVGTQMVAKGLDFPNVTLVGVLAADQSMYSDDYKGFERTFALLTQVVGRSGRGDVPGKAYIQTMSPDSDVIRLAAKQDYEAFYNNEIMTRKLMIYPPYCDIVTVVSASPIQNNASAAAGSFVSILTEAVKKDFNDVKVIILRPTPTAVPRVNNKYRYRIVIKCKNNNRFREMLRSSLDIYYKSALAKSAPLSVDVNPEGSI